MTRVLARGLWWCCWLLCLHGAPAAAQAPPLRLDASPVAHTLAPHASYLHDRDGTLDLAAVRAAAARGAFDPAPRDRPNFGYVDGALWFRFRLEGAAAEPVPWLLSIEYPLLDHLTLYAIAPDGSIEERHSGDREPFGSRAAALRFPNFAVELVDGETREYYLRVASQSSMQVPVVLARADRYLESLMPAHVGLGIYYGIQLALLLYNLILWVSVRDRNFLWYVLYVAALGALLFCLNGLAFQYLWPESPDWGNVVIPLGIALSNLCMLQFSRSFLELSRQAPRADRVVLAFMLLAALPLPGVFALSYRVVVQYQTLLALVIAPVILVCALLCQRRYPPARHFLLAWTALLVGVVVYAAVSLGLLPKTPLTEYSMQIGSAAEMILLSFALAWRLNLLKAENERIQREAREQLEARVRARTAELDATMHRLEEANRRLHDFSRRDGLTGVYNRRHFDDVLVQACNHASEQVRPLALLMLDVDHFKQVNDRYGHAVGDDCLRAVAQLLGKRAREAGATVARYGGEEFALVLPDHDLERARRVAESICVDVARRPVVAEGVQVPLTISIGLHALPAGYPCTAAGLLRQADAALYRAKDNGRNRIEVASLD